MRLKHFVVFMGLLTMAIQTRADEGMWLLSLLEGYTIEDMQAEGFKLTAEDIYSVNNACLKDAVIIFGGGCTGEIISGEGLLLTNHHCGYGAIQRHSSVEHDYLTDGFWAMSKDEELPNSSLSVQFLRYMKDVTDQVLDGTQKASNARIEQSVIRSNINEILEAELEGKNLEGNVRPMFYGNQYFLFIYERYTDVRLVGAPPSSIGNFGEDSDNWVWPRHTGDFSIFRIYADENNEPSDYSPDNVPYKPGKFFEISMDGVEEGDFTMVMGYPGSTQQFLYSRELEIMMQTSLPLKIDLRTQRLDIMDNYMDQSDAVRIQYASKYRGVSNSWKKWKGVIRGLERLDAVQKKMDLEAAFSEWVASSEKNTEEYGKVLPEFSDIYEELSGFQVVSDLMREAVLAVETFRQVSSAVSLLEDTADIERMETQADRFYKDFYTPIDKEIFAAMMAAYKHYATAEFYPDFFAEVEKKFNGDYSAFADKVYDKSLFSSRDNYQTFIELCSKSQDKAWKKLEKDPLYIFFGQFRELYGGTVMPTMAVLESSLDELYKTYVKARMEFEPEKRQYPDANFTMRLTYGKVEGYLPEDAVEYKHYTTLSGVIEKSKQGVVDWVIPERLESLYEEKDFGAYGVNGTMPVCFSASNHTSGGNSGSPVLNADGRLIGINFDRNWHGTMSDEMYDPDMCRNISVDIRYVLFIIDKYAGADYLLDEMVLHRDM